MITVARCFSQVLSLVNRNDFARADRVADLRNPPNPDNLADVLFVSPKAFGHVPVDRDNEKPEFENTLNP